MNADSKCKNHPDRAVKAKGLCGSCYNAANKAGKSPASTPSFPAKAKGSVTPKKVSSEPSPKEIMLEAGAGIQLAQELVFKKFPQYRAQDELSDAEVGMLARGLAGEVLSNEFLLKWYKKLHSVGGAHGTLAAAVLAIALPRMANHGVIPAEIAFPLAGIAVMAASGKEFPSEPDRPDSHDAVPNEAGGTLPHNGENGFGQEPTGSFPSGFQTGLTGVSVENGQGPAFSGQESDYAEVVPLRNG